MKNLVLGGSGMIGGHLCTYLNELGEEVINLDIKDGFDLRTDDLEPYKDVDYVWFLAWDVGGSKYLTAEENLKNIIRNNTIICEKVFTFLDKYNLPFMFASSQLAETDNTYGITKILGEEWAKLLGGKVVKFWNVYGWEEPGQRSHVIPDFVWSALTNKKIELLTSGDEERQFVYADDCVRNLYKMKSLEGKQFDLTNGDWVTIRQLAEVIGERLGASVVPGATKGYNNRVDPTNVPSEFEFKISLEEGINRIVLDAEKYLVTHDR